MTLIEVALGLAILGTLLATVLVARGRHLHQLAVAQRKQVAIAATDRLLTQWFDDIESFPRDSNGKVPGNDKLAWRTTTLPAPLSKEFEAEVIHVEILENRPGLSQDTLASLEIVLPKTKPQASTQPSESNE